MSLSTKAYSHKRWQSVVSRESFEALTKSQHSKRQQFRGCFLADCSRSFLVGKSFRHISSYLLKLDLPRLKLAGLAMLDRENREERKKKEKDKVLERPRVSRRCLELSNLH